MNQSQALQEANKLPSESDLKFVQELIEVFQGDYYNNIDEAEAILKKVKEYSSSKDKEIEELKTKYEVLEKEFDMKCDSLVNAISQLAQNTASSSSGERGDRETATEQEMIKKGQQHWKSMETLKKEGGYIYSKTLMYLIDKIVSDVWSKASKYFKSLPHPSTKEFSREEVKNTLIHYTDDLRDYVRESKTNISADERDSREYVEIYLRHNHIAPSSHTEVMGVNSSVTKSKWAESLKVNAP